MAQRVSNIYGLVRQPKFYEGVQVLLGAQDSRVRYARDILRAKAGMKVLDVGCGPATILPYLPEVDYTGIDLNEKHIAHAKREFGSRGRFLVGDVTQSLAREAESFDLIIVSALLHHLDDGSARQLLGELCKLAKSGARIITFDCVWLARQNPVAWTLIRLDSGLNVRHASGYLQLVEDLPVTVEHQVFRDFLRIPYDHFCMTLTKA